MARCQCVMAQGKAKVLKFLRSVKRVGASQVSLCTTGANVAICSPDENHVARTLVPGMRLIAFAK